MKKICLKCGLKKLSDDFRISRVYKGKRYFRGTCKECDREYNQKWLKDNPDWVKRRNKMNAIKFREKNQRRANEWRKKNPNGSSKGFRKKYPLKTKAHWAVNNQMRAGKIKKEQCSYPDCSRLDVQAHHFDYSKPLKILWFCQPHHSLADRVRQASEKVGITINPDLCKL